MSWLTRLWGRDHPKEPPEHIRVALETAQRADEATGAAHKAAAEYRQVRDAQIRLARIDAEVAVRRKSGVRK